MNKIFMAFVLVALGVSGLFADEAAAELKPVSNTVTLQLFTIYAGGSYFRPHFSLEHKLWEQISVNIAGDLQMSVGHDENFLGMGVGFDIIAGLKYWLKKSNRLDGMFLGTNVEKFLGLAYRQHFGAMSSVSRGLEISDGLKFIETCGWQWVSAKNGVFNLALSVAFFDDTQNRYPLKLSSPQIALSIGRAW